MRRIAWIVALTAALFVVGGCSTTEDEEMAREMAEKRKAEAEKRKAAQKREKARKSGSIPDPMSDMFGITHDRTEISNLNGLGDKDRKRIQESWDAQKQEMEELRREMNRRHEKSKSETQKWVY